MGSRARCATAQAPVAGGRSRTRWRDCAEDAPRDTKRTPRKPRVPDAPIVRVPAFRGDRVGPPDEGHGSGFAYSPRKRRARDRGNCAVHGHGSLGAGLDATRSATGREEAVMGTILLILLVL